MKDWDESNILVIDSSGSQLRLGLSFGGDRLVESNEVVGQTHGQVMIKKIADLFESAGIGREGLDGICVCTGPGSFTGLRIGMAAAKGMAVALKIPVVGVSLFEIAAYKLGNVTEPVAVVTPLRKNEYGVGEVNGGKLADKGIAAVAASRLRDFIGNRKVACYQCDVSEITEKPENEQMSRMIYYSVGELIYLAREKLAGGRVEDLSALEPLYVQKSQAEIRFERRGRS